MFGRGIAVLRLMTPCGRLSVLSCYERLFSQMSILEMMFCLATPKYLCAKCLGVMTEFLPAIMI